MGEQADRNEGSESMKDHFGAPLLYLEFHKNGIEPILELQYSFLAE